MLEAREASGGTWDLFRYPGIRSDSDMFTFGFSWRPWPGDRALADGPSILTYLRTVAEEYGVDELIRYRHKVRRASWDSETALWTVEIDTGPDGGTPTTTMTASFLWGCAGYYHYDEPYAPEFPGADELRGHDRPPSALARGPRSRRQAGRGDRQRRDRDHAGAGDGRDRRARDDAAALADLRRLPARPRPVRAPAVQAARPGCPIPLVRWANILQRHRAPSSSPGAGPSS